MNNAQSATSDNAGFYTFSKQLVLVLYKTYRPQKSSVFRYAEYFVFVEKKKLRKEYLRTGC